MELEELPYQVVYRPVKDNKLPDWLSCAPNLRVDTDVNDEQHFENKVYYTEETDEGATGVWNTVKAFMDGWVLRHGYPQVLLSDRMWISNNICEAQETMKHNYNRTAKESDIVAGDLVLVKDENRRFSVSIVQKPQDGLEKEESQRNRGGS